MKNTMNKENIFDEIKGVRTRKLFIDMPESFTATVISVSKHQGMYGNSLRLDLQDKKGITFDIYYRIPKAFTGNGQLDKLLDSLKELNVSIEKIQGKTFEWKRQELSGTMKGNPRHYPVRLARARLRPSTL